MALTGSHLDAAHLLDAIQHPVLIVDGAGAVRQGNSSALRMFGEDDAPPPLGRPLADVLNAVIPREATRLMLERRSTDRQELEVERNARWYCLSIDPIAGGDGGRDGAVVMLTDITDRHRLDGEHRRRAEELAIDSRRKDEFLAMLAHELRNPLNAISAANTILDRVGSRDAGSVRLRTIISRQTRHLARMVDDLLDVSRVTRGKIELRKTAVDLVQMVKHAVQASQTVLEPRKQRVSLALPAEPVIVEGDELRLEQIVINLLSNASKYSAPNSVINVALSAGGQGSARAELHVTDGGVGVPANMLEAIFEPFVQVDPPLARSLGGLGIGLSMVKSLVEMHGGRVAARSGGLGHGTEVIVELPLTGASVGAHAGAAEGATPGERALEVLVIEDNVDVRELLETWLRLLGHHVQTATDGQSGLDLLSSTDPDLAFVDIGLPAMDGFEVARSARGAGHHTYLVAVTGYGHPEDRARALDAGFDDFIVKPIDQASLEKVLRKPGVTQGSPSSRRGGAS